MRHFHGVATKYLENYLGWMRMLDRETKLTPARVLAISAQTDWRIYPHLMRT